MKILVTGGAGNVGQGVVARLVKSGHDVRVVDWKIHERKAGAEYIECDITNFNALRELVRGMDTIVHLAAFPYPAAAPSAEMFRVNCGGTYNVFEAASVEGIKRVVFASSINALGYNFGVVGFPIEYFPVDEEHRTFTTDPYSFSKETTESIGRYYWRRDGISSTCLRMPFVYTITDQMTRWTRMFVEGGQRFLQAYLNLPPEEQKGQIERMKAGLAEKRAARVWEKPFEGRWDENDVVLDPSMMAFFGYTDFWSIISVEDTAQAFEKSILGEFEGSHPLYLSERENVAGIESETLLSIFYPEVSGRRRPLPGRSSLLSYERARNLIGYEPEYLLRERI